MGRKKNLREESIMDDAMLKTSPKFKKEGWYKRH